MNKPLLLIGLCAALMVSVQAQAATLSEGFESGIPSDWVLVNNSNPLGVNGDNQAGWHQSEADLTQDPPVLDTEGFGPHSGNFYACARDASTLNEGNIDTWMLTPVMTFNAGDTVSFWTRALANNSDSLELRFGTSTNCGTQAPDLAGAAADFPSLLDNVGDFTTVVGSVNPWQPDGSNANVFPTDWAQYTFTMPVAGTGRLGFRYLVYDGGYTGANSWVIGVDDVQITPAPEPASMCLLALGGLGMLFRRR